MEHEINLKWLEGMAFEGTQPDGYKIRLDAAENPAVNSTKPKPLLLTALAGCTGMDVASLMVKMRMELKGLSIKVKGVVTDDHPKHYKSMHITYQFTGKNLDREKIDKVISMSQEKYCGVSALFKMAIPVTYSVEIEE